MKLLITITALLVLLAGCGEEDTSLADQRTKIVSYLTSTHVPKLIAEADVAEQGQLPYYTTLGSTVFRYIEGVYNPDRPNRKEVVRGSKVTFTFSSYVFNFQNITDEMMPYFSNDKLLEQKFYNSGLTPGEWVFEPVTVEIGRTEIIKGLESALIGCREGDRVEAYMTYNMAYGDMYFNIIPLKSPIAYFFSIDSVE